MTSEQRRVASGMAAAAMLVLAVGAACAVTGWRPWGFATDPAGRLVYGLACILPPAACLALAIGRVAAHRFLTADDIAGSGLTPGTASLRPLTAILQNTLEQAALAVPIYLAAAAMLPERWLGTVAGASILFVTGRIGFARGYRAGAANRAFGFALGFYASLALLVASIATVTFR